MYMTSDDIGSGWNDMQVREFARRFAHTHQASWHAYVSSVREALIDSFILLVVLGQDRNAVPVCEVRILRSRLGTRLATHHRMTNEAAHTDKE